MARDEVEAVRSANERFYQAFESLDLGEMDRVWAKGEHVKCVHPGWGLLTGWEEVRGSWEAIFRNTAEIRFTLTDVQIEIRGPLAWVALTENILSQSQGNVAVTSILATNLFERQGDDWLLVHHHASHILGPSVPAAEQTPESA